MICNGKAILPSRNSPDLLPLLPPTHLDHTTVAILCLEMSNAACYTKSMTLGKPLVCIPHELGSVFGPTSMTDGGMEQMMNDII